MKKRAAEIACVVLAVYSIILTVIVVRGFSGSCAPQKNEAVINETGYEDSGKYRGIVDDMPDLDSTVGAHAIEIDEALALDIGNAVIKSAYGEEAVSINDTEFLVYEVKGKNIFVVSRGPKGGVLGGDHSVAIDKTDGSILKVWSGE